MFFKHPAIANSISRSLVETLIALMLIVVILYVHFALKDYWSFEPEKLKDILIYSSIVWLMGKDVHISAQSYDFEDLFVAVLVIIAALFAAYTVYKFRKYGFEYMFSQEKSTVLSSIFLTAFMYALGLVSERVGTGSLALTIVAVLVSYNTWQLHRIV